MKKETSIQYLKIIIFLAVAFFIITQYILYADEREVIIVDLYYIQAQNNHTKVVDITSEKDEIEYSRQRRRILRMNQNSPLIVPFIQELFFGSITIDSSFPLSSDIVIDKWLWADRYTRLFVYLNEVEKATERREQAKTSENRANEPEKVTNSAIIKKWIAYNLKKNGLTADIKVISNGYLF